MRLERIARAAGFSWDGSKSLQEDRRVLFLVAGFRVLVLRLRDLPRLFDFAWGELPLRFEAARLVREDRVDVLDFERRRFALAGAGAGAASELSLVSRFTRPSAAPTTRAAEIRTLLSSFAISYAPLIVQVSMNNWRRG